MSETACHDGTRIFETQRRALVGLAYRMLGSRAEAEDVVQDAFLRWHATDRAAIEEPRRYLSTIVTRLCLDRMKSAQARREVYVGQWISLDPKWLAVDKKTGEYYTDATHIKFGHSVLDENIYKEMAQAVAEIIGQLKLEIIDFKKDKE